MLFLQNHDQVGNRAFGERLASLAKPDALRAATTLLLLSPQIPMLFMGEEWGATAPFLFFTDHNAELAPLVTQGRRREFAKFAAFQDPETRERIPDPNAEGTFRDSIPDPAEAERPPHAAVLDLHRRLLALRRERIVPHLPGASSLGAEAVGEGAVLARWRLGDGSRLTIDEARQLAPYNSATSLQVAAGVLGGMVWAIEHPSAGIVEADDLDFRRVLEVARPYLGSVVGVYTDWTPLDNRAVLFPEDVDPTDPWQFKNILVA